MTNVADAPPPSDRADETRRVARGAGVVGGATMLSRVLGLVRDQVMAILFGAGLATDAFNVAFRIPNLLRDLFAEGAMSSAFVPVFTEVHHTRGAAAAWALGRQVLMTLGIVLAVLTAIAWLFAAPLVGVFAAGFATVPGKLELTTTLTRIMLPFLPLVALAAAAMGMLNARGVFGVPALAPALLNVGMVVFGVALIPVAGRFGQPPIVAMAWGVVIGGALQFLVQLPSLARLGFTPRLERPTLPPEVRRIGARMLPATLGLAATQINLFVSTVIASLLQQGSVSWLYFAFRLMQLPIGVFGVALATVSLPSRARAAVAGDTPGLKRTLDATLRLVFVLTVPAAAWLAVMAGPVIALLFEHGRFGAGDTRATAAALMMYCVGLPAFAAVGVLTRTFYALGETRVPVLASFVAVAVNLALNLAFIGPLAPLGLGHLGLALATSVTSIVNLVQLVAFLRRRIGALGLRRLATTLVRVAVASALAVAPGAIAVAAWGGAVHGRLGAELALVAGSFVAAVAIGWVVLRVLRVEEASVAAGLARSLARRLRGRA